MNGVVELQIGVLDDSDGDGMPNQLPNDYDSAGALVEDTDDDGDSFSDVREIECGTDPLDASSVVTDLDGDSICDELDDDIDGDGLLNDEETNTGNFDNEFDSLTDSANPDTDGDGVCDGPATPDAGICVAGPDAFPDDPAASLDTDGDGMPDELNGESTTGLIEDEDDDNDIIDDVTELMCGTDPKVVNALPDNDGDGICDALDENDDIVDLPFTLTYSTNNLMLTIGRKCQF